MFFSLLKKNLKDMLHRKEFLFTFTFSILLICVPFIVDCLSFYHSNSIYIRPAWFYWGETGVISTSNRAVMLYLGIFLPFLASMAYSYCHFDNKKFGVINQLLPRTGASAYFRSTACTAFLGGFLVVLLPLLLQQLLFCIACPWSGFQCERHIISRRG